MENHAYLLFIQGVTVNQLKLANAKLQSDPGSAALKLMDCLFESHEMVNGNPSGTTKSKDVVRQETIKLLDPVRMKFIYGMWNVDSVCGNSVGWVQLCHLCSYMYKRRYKRWQTDW